MQFNKLALFIVFSLLCHQGLKAQYQSSPVWVFGHHAGIDFTNPNNPVPINTSITTHSAKSSTQCDAAGNILFYANGYNIWDSQGNVMPGSSNPVWPSYVSSWSLQSYIVPDPADTSRYYVFSVFPSDGNPPYGAYFVGQLTYSLVDMKLNGGLGGIVPGMAHVLVDKNAGNYIQVVPDDKCNLWLIAQKGAVHNFDFKCYKITPQGISATPVVSPMAKLPSAIPAFIYGVDNRNGNMIYSYTRNKIFVAYNAGDLYVFDFNPATGIVSNPNLLGWNYAPTNTQSSTLPGICLSPDESMLYTSGYTYGSQYELRQYPINSAGTSVSLGPPAVVYASNGGFVTIVQQTTGFVWCDSDIQLGPDNKIYIAFNMGQNFLGRIEQPNLPGAACNVNPFAVTLQPNTYTTNALPVPMVKRAWLQPIQGTKTDTSVCFQASVLLHAPDTSYISYLWQNGQSGKTFTATQSGVYTVQASNNACQTRTDTFDVRFTDFDLSLGDDLAACEPVTLYANTNAAPPFSYLWQDGSTDGKLDMVLPGTYWVQVSKDGCTAADTIAISQGSLQLALGDDTTICKGSRIVLNAYTEGATYAWHDAATGSEYIADKEGTYSVTVKKGFCEAADTIQVRQQLCDCNIFIPSAFSPNNDGRNDLVHAIIPPGCPLNFFQLSIYNRWGQLVFSSVDPSQKWDGTFQGEQADAGTYMYYLEYVAGRKSRQMLSGDITLIR